MIYATIALALVVSATVNPCLPDPHGQCERFFIRGCIFGDAQFNEFNAAHRRGFGWPKPITKRAEAYMIGIAGMYGRKSNGLPAEYGSEFNDCFEAFNVWWRNVKIWDDNLDHQGKREWQDAVQIETDAQGIKEQEQEIMGNALSIVEAQIRLLNARGIKVPEQKLAVQRMVRCLELAMRHRSISDLSYLGEPGCFPQGKRVALLFPQHHFNAGQPLRWFNVNGAKQRAEATKRRKKAEEAELKRRTAERLQKEQEQQRRKNADEARKNQLQARIGKEVDRMFAAMKKNKLPDHQILNTFSKPNTYSAAALKCEKKRAKAFMKVMRKYHPNHASQKTKSLEEQIRAAEIFKNLNDVRDRTKKSLGYSENP